MEVASVATDPGSIDPALGVEEPVFRVRVSIIEVAPRVPNAEERLRPGMTLTGNLVLERRRLWEVLFNPIRTALAR
jgi:hypothetical protein